MRHQPLGKPEDMPAGDYASQLVKNPLHAFFFDCFPEIRILLQIFPCIHTFPLPVKVGLSDHPSFGRNPPSAASCPGHQIHSCVPMRTSGIDTVFYIADLISLNIEKINFILINCMLKEIIFPLIYTLINKNQQNVTIYHSLYMLCLILFTIKNEFLYKVITTYLFTEKISNNIFSKMPAIPFQNINKNFMDNINFLITNYQYADVNDQFWQTIKTYMKSTNGIDLSTGEIDIENIYDTLKNLMINMINLE